MSIFEKVREIIIEQTGASPDSISMETDLRQDLNADSLDLFQIINDVEDAFDIQIEDAESVATVGDAVRIIEALGKGEWL